MRTKLLLLVALSSLFAGQSPAQSPYPSKPIQMLVGFPAGGGNDILARLLGAKLQEAWGQPVVVVNKPGASSLVAMEYVAKAPPDGYTLLLNASVMPVLAASYKSLSVDILRDFEPITQLTTQSFVLVVHPSLAARSVKELIQLASSKPGKLNYGSGAATFQFATEMFNQQAGIKLNHISYKGSAQTIAGMLANDVQVGFVDAPALVPQIKAGKLRALAVTTRTRSPILPQVPTMIEAGVPDYEVVGWFALFAPAGTPKPIVNKLYEESAKIVKMADMRDKLTNLDCIPVGSTPGELRAIMKKQVNQWIAIAKAGNIKPQ